VVKRDLKNFREIPIEEWNSTSFKAYLSYLFKGKYGYPCTHGKPQVENKLITNLCKEYDKLTVKTFVEKCVELHKPYGNFNNCNFSMMCKSMKHWVMPKVVVQYTNKDIIEEDMSEEELNGMF